ncbi:hypothetical protein HYH03_014284 [Edaphochlamys debaryana]|uniref:Apple domain-containing protein n=1 Tax=Edaphochlamys debaryana TaxID=47281 RepID=A0A835XMY8_9CHLO|nr:hypothetical protein HYH03_014284 [Edaphochlamys debaryana]|eukprot:KAG2487038.1 hypothetical protein HYH03_014284 [Edaphochlamys debaryana]
MGDGKRVERTRWLLLAVITAILIRHANSVLCLPDGTYDAFFSSTFVQGQDGTQTLYAGTSDGAQAACTPNPNCLGFDASGFYLIGTSYSSAFSLFGCLWIKKSGPPAPPPSPFVLGPNGVATALPPDLRPECAHFDFARNVLVSRFDSGVATGWRDVQFGAGRDQALGLEEVEGGGTAAYGSGFLDLSSAAGVLPTDLPTGARTRLPPSPKGGTEGAYYYADASGGIALREAFTNQPPISVGPDRLTVGTSLCMGTAKSRALVGAVLVYNRALSVTDLKRVHESYAPRFNWTRGGGSLVCLPGISMRGDPVANTTAPTATACQTACNGNNACEFSVYSNTTQTCLLRRNGVNGTTGLNGADPSAITCFSRPNYGNYYCIRNWDIAGTNILFSFPMDKNTCLGDCDRTPNCQYALVSISPFVDCITNRNIFGGPHGVTQPRTDLNPDFSACIKARIYPRTVECGKWTKGGPGETRLQSDCDGDGLLDAILVDASGARGVALSSKGCSTEDADTGYPDAPTAACPALFVGLCPKPPGDWCPGGEVLQLDCDADGVKDLACLLSDDRGNLTVVRSGQGCSLSTADSYCPPLTAQRSCAYPAGSPCNEGRMLSVDCDNDGVRDWVCLGEGGQRGVVPSRRACDASPAVSGYPAALDRACPVLFGVSSVSRPPLPPTPPAPPPPPIWLRTDCFSYDGNFCRWGLCSELDEPAEAGAVRIATCSQQCPTYRSINGGWCTSVCQQIPALTFGDMGSDCLFSPTDNNVFLARRNPLKEARAECLSFDGANCPLDVCLTGLELAGDNIQIAAPVGSLAACQQLCSQEPQCEFSVYDSASRQSTLRRNGLAGANGTNALPASSTTCFSRPNYGNFYCVKGWDINGRNLWNAFATVRNSCPERCNSDPTCTHTLNGIPSGGLGLQCYTNTDIFQGSNGATQPVPSLGDAFEACIKARTYSEPVA